MEKLKKKKKYYFPYKLFDIEKRAKSQVSLFKTIDKAPFSSPLISKNKLGIYNYSKKLKSTILSSKIFSYYMDNYLGQTQDFCFKSPSNMFYPIKKNFQLLPLNSKKYNIFEESKTSYENLLNSVVEKPYGYKYKKTRIIIKDNNTKELHHSASERLKAKIFIKFSEGDHYHKVLMKTFGLKNIDINNSKNVIKDNYNYLKECLKNLYNVENFISEKDFEFKIRINWEDDDIIFNMKIFSLCLNFYKSNYEKEGEKNVNKFSDKKKLYLPFKILPLFYLLNYSEFKNFLSEIIYYDTDTDSMNIEPSLLKNALGRYAQYSKNNIKNDRNYIKSISFYKNEYLYKREYDWIVSDKDPNVKNHIYKLKISFPKVIFEKKSENIKIKNRLNKNVLIQILKKNFINWEKLILFDLFSNKKFRYIINNILTGGNKYNERTIKLFKHENDKVNNTDIKNENIEKNNENNINKNYEFFLTEIMKRKTFYYIFTPNIILLLSGDKYKLYQKIELNLQESKILYKISKFWGILNTLFKCMYKDEATNKIYFKLNILNNLPNFLYKSFHNTINTREMSFSKEDKKSKNIQDFLEYKSKDLELIISNCLLKIIKITKNEKTFSFFKMPKELFKAIISSNNKIKIINSIINKFNEIIDNRIEVDILKEEENLKEKAERNNNKDYDKFSLSKKPTFRTLKSNPIKTFNKLKTTSGNIVSQKFIFSNDNVKSLNKKNSILRRNKNEQKDSGKKKSINAPKFSVFRNNIEDFNKYIERNKEFNKDEIENINEKFKKDISQINSSEQFRKYKFNKKYTIDFRKKNP